MDKWLDIAIEAEVEDVNGNRCFVAYESGSTHSEFDTRKLFLKQLSEFGLSVVKLIVTKNEEHDWSEDKNLVDGQQTCTMCGRMTERDETNTLSITIPRKELFTATFKPLCDECYDILYDRKKEIERTDVIDG